MTTQSDWLDLPGKLIVVSGPSGSGKTTLVRRLAALKGLADSLKVSVSATTRAPREDEQHGHEYFFLTRAEFEAMRDRGDMLEWAEVHGNLYGTPANPVRKSLEQGMCVLLEIDVQGALSVRDQVPSALLIFVNTPTFEILESRLRYRSTDDEATIARRLHNARWEIEQVHRYDHVIINDTLDRALGELLALLSSQGCGGGVSSDA